MTWTSLINHLLHLFSLPVCLGLGFVLFEGGKRVFRGRQNTTPPLPLYALSLLLLGLVAQLALLFAMQKDGTVLGYAWICLVMGLGHFCLTRAWRVGRA